MRRPKEHAEIGERVLSQLRKRGINMENKRLIELVNVSKDYDGDVALNNINLYIRDGEFLTLLWPFRLRQNDLAPPYCGFHYAVIGQNNDGRKGADKCSAV